MTSKLVRNGRSDRVDFVDFGERAQDATFIRDRHAVGDVTEIGAIQVLRAGNGGPVTQGDMFEFRKAQEEGTKQIKNALFIKTTDFARPAELSPCPTHGHHWFANAESYFLIGEAAGEGMKKLLK